MYKKAIGKFFGAFLLFVITGAFFFCAFTTTMPMGSETHTMPLAQDMPMAHSTHLSELTLATAGTNFPVLDVFMLTIIFVAFAALFAPALHRGFSLGQYLRQKFCDIIYCVQKIAHDWLSLFELSPSFA